MFLHHTSGIINLFDLYYTYVPNSVKTKDLFYFNRYNDAFRLYLRAIVLYS